MTYKTTFAALSLLALSATASAAPPPDFDRELGPMPTQEYVQDINDKWTGVGVGYNNGLWGTRFAQSLTLSVPLGRKGWTRHFGVRARGNFVHTEDQSGKFTPVTMGGGEIFGRTPVLLGVVRTYGGFGFYGGTTLGHDEAEAGLVGGGHYGVEVLATPRTSFTFEVGGQSPLHPDQVDMGASVMAGTTVYLGKVRRK